MTFSSLPEVSSNNRTVIRLILYYRVGVTCRIIKSAFRTVYGSGKMRYGCEHVCSHCERCI